MLKASAIPLMARSFIVLVTIAAWFSLSNHCALGLGLAPAKSSAPAEAGECPMHSAPAKKKQPAQVPCCKDLRAVKAKSAAHAMAAALIGSASAQTDAPEIFLPLPRIAFGVETLDTGPPGAVTFAESVLQRSMRAHAPPVS